MFASFLFFHICIFSQEKNHLSVLSPSLAGSVWTAVPSPQPQSLGVPQAPSWCYWPTAYLCPLTLLLLTSWPWLGGPFLTDAALPDRAHGPQPGCPAQELVSFLWSEDGLAPNTWHTVVTIKVCGKQKERCLWTWLGRALEETVCSSISLCHLLGDLGHTRLLL